MLNYYTTKIQYPLSGKSQSKLGISYPIDEWEFISQDRISENFIANPRLGKICFVRDLISLIGDKIPDWESEVWNFCLSPKHV